MLMNSCPKVETYFDDEDDRGISKIETPSGIQEMTVINESGLYSLILSSKLPGAKKFKRWVTSEVLDINYFDYCFGTSHFATHHKKRTLT